MRIELKVFRTRLGLTQEEMSNKLNVNRSTYHAIENGKRVGSNRFWNNLQKTFNVNDEEMWKLTKIN